MKTSTSALQYLSVCSGIEAATVAWEPLGWKAVGFSEIDAFPRAVLAHRYPHVPLHGDFTALIADPPSCDVLVGGTPCQAFSVAGARQSLDDARGNLSLAYVELANAIDLKNPDTGTAACIVVWENVPGVFSTKDNAFGCFLAGLAGEDGPLEPPGGRWTNCGAVRGPQRAVAWRVLDAQYFGLAQRRRRVFVVASARAGFDPTQVLLESEGVRRDTPPSREARKDPAAASGVGTAPRGGENAGKCVNNQTPLVGVTGDSASACWCPDVSGPLGGAGQSGGFRTTDLDNNGAYILDAPIMAVRRLTPRECERLQGFPDDYTIVPWRGKPCPDGPRYKALGNSMAVPVMRWIGRRIDEKLRELP